MRYDLDLIFQLCGEIGLSANRRNDRVEIALGPGTVLAFENAERDEDCLVGFDGTPWHSHDDFIFDDGLGSYVELTYVDIVTGLGDGQILVCERWQVDLLLDRWLVHRDYNDLKDEFQHLKEGEALRIQRVVRN